MRKELYGQSGHKWATEQSERVAQGSEKYKNLGYRIAKLICEAGISFEALPGLFRFVQNILIPGGYEMPVPAATGTGKETPGRKKWVQGKGWCRAEGDDC